ncbi:hypothetical protein AB4Z54_50960, partial [Streptomyces sp. MCAF7]
ESAPELTREQRAHGWTPLSDQDPRSLGPFTLHGHIRTHGSTTVYLGRGPDGEYAVLRTMGPRTRRRSALLALSTEAQALQRMRGDYAPRLMGQDLQAELPWIAEEHVLTADGALARTLTTLLSDGTVRSWDARMAATIGWHLAQAVCQCSAAGMVHGQLTADTVLVADFSVKLVGWHAAVIESPKWLPIGRPSAADDVFALGEILLALGGGRRVVHDERTTKNPPR